MSAALDWFPFPVLNAGLLVLIGAGLLHYLRVAREARDACLACDEQMRQIVGALPDAAVVVDRNGVIIMLNALAETAYGYAGNELIGQKIEVLVPPRLREAHVRYREQYMAHPSLRSWGDRIPAAPIDFRAVRSDGTEFAVDLALGPLPSRRGLTVLAITRPRNERQG